MKSSIELKETTQQILIRKGNGTRVTDGMQEAL